MIANDFNSNEMYLFFLEKETAPFRVVCCVLWFHGKKVLFGSSFQKKNVGHFDSKALAQKKNFGQQLLISIYFNLYNKKWHLGMRELDLLLTRRRSN